jgi:hypothetical protein
MDEELFVYCPFNKSHQIDKTKLITHINKCKDKKNFPNQKVIKCEKTGTYFLELNKETHYMECDMCQMPKVEVSINLTIANETIMNPYQLNISNMTDVNRTQLSFNEASFIQFDDYEIKEDSNIY